MPKLHLVVIDPQKDFALKSGSLYVPGAEGFMDNVASMIERLGKRIKKISISLDSHQRMDISHPLWFKDAAGHHPDPFTIITAEDMKNGKWTTSRPTAFNKTLQYLEALAAANRYPHCIWPYHCLIGDNGCSMYENFNSAINEWSLSTGRNPLFIAKGSNPETEHFSAVKAEVPDPRDPTTQINMDFIQSVESDDIIALTGLARSHCLANTVYDIRDNFSDRAYTSKLVLLEDCTGDVPTFEHFGEKFVKELTADGMQVTNSRDFLAA